MPKYNYKAKDLAGKTVSGTVEAKDENDLYSIIRSQNQVLLKANVQESVKVTYKMKSKQVSEFARELADMISAGIPIVKSIGIMRERDIKGGVKNIYDILYRYVSGGNTLSEAMKQCGGALPELFVNMIASGEESGKLEETTRKMAVHYDKEHRLNGKVKSAMMYPKILMILTLGVVLIIFTFVIPVFMDVFKGMELPLITRIVMAASNFLTKRWYYVGIGGLSIVAVWQYLIVFDKVRMFLDKVKFKIPIVKKLLPVIYTARFARTLSSLYSSGLPVMTALGIASGTVGNKYIESQFPAVLNMVKSGEPLSKAMKEIKGFDRKLVDTIYMGEESGQLVNMLESIAESFEYEAEGATTRLVGILEPLMIVVMALVIGSIMCAVMLPIFSMYNNIK